MSPFYLPLAVPKPGRWQPYAGVLAHSTWKKKHTHYLQKKTKMFVELEILKRSHKTFYPLYILKKMDVNNHPIKTMCSQIYNADETFSFFFFFKKGVTPFI